MRPSAALAGGGQPVVLIGRRAGLVFSSDCESCLQTLTMFSRHGRSHGWSGHRSPHTVFGDHRSLRNKPVDPRSATATPGHERKRARKAMNMTRYLIVGGGLTADAACKGIRERRPRRHDRARGRRAASALRAAAALEGALEGRRGEHDLARHRRTRRRAAARPADRRARPRATRGARRPRRTYSYEKLLLATGGRPRRLPFGGDEVDLFPHARRLPARCAHSPTRARASS